MFKQIFLFTIFIFIFHTTQAKSTKEKLIYRIHYGWINIAEAAIVTDKKAEINNTPCYKVDIYGSTKGIVKFISKVNNHWGSYIDATSYKPYQFYRFIKEGKYRKNEVVYFDHKNRKITVKELDKENPNKIIKTKQYAMQQIFIQDIVSASYQLRKLDYKKLKPKDIINFNIFFDHEESNYQAKFLGIEKLKTDIGIYYAYVFAPFIPRNKVFKKKHPIKVWISNDEARIPLKIKANLKIGGIQIDIKKKIHKS